MPFTSVVVFQALQGKGPTKTPGPDGSNPLFFQKNWSIVGGDVTKVVLQILNENRDPKKFNYTYIKLIPKLAKCASPKDY